jgi:undecaprenyl-diphosphatase
MAKSDRKTDRRRIPRGRITVLRDLLYTTLRFIARHIRGFYGALAAFLTVGVIVGFISVGVFALFAAAVARGLTQSIDEGTLQWFEGHRTPARTEVMIEITTLGNGAVLVVLVLACCVFLWQTRHRWSVYLLILGTLGGKILNDLLKEFFDRPRPSVVVHVDTVSSMSFPSGHAMVSLIVYGSVAYLVGRLEPTSRLRTTTWVFAAIIILMIGISRMYLGVHYPSDVIAGFIAGAAWLAFVASTMTALQFFASRRPETRREEKDLNAEREREVAVRG